MIRLLSSEEGSFKEAIREIVLRGEGLSQDVEGTVKEILEAVKDRGDEAVLEFTRRFDGILIGVEDLLVSEDELDGAFSGISREVREVLEIAARRIETFHRASIPRSWFITEEGIILGQKVRPLKRVCIYAPGGKAIYPSTVLMNAIPAKVAGVKEVFMATPPSREGIDPLLLAAARIAGVDRVYRVGGAQAIAAFAYGTETIPRVDKITGPGNIYVATAKRLVYGDVDIDMIAGPSEILIVNDGTGRASWMAADMISQAEHDELASAILLTTSRRMAEEVRGEIERQVEALPRRAIAEASLRRYGAIIVVRDLEEAISIANDIAPEHLELLVEDPFSILERVENAGAIFLGPYTPEPIGDYVAGPNHTLPTGGSARFSSPLGVEDFVKASSILAFSKEGLKRLGQYAIDLAGLEGLEGHGRSVSIRMEGTDG